MMMRKSLLIASFLSVFFLLLPRNSWAASCDYLPKEIYVNITAVEISCEGLEANKKYNAFVEKFKKDGKDTGGVPGTNNNCGASDSSGNLVITLPARPEEGNYEVKIYDATLLCTKIGSSRANTVLFTVTGSKTIMEEAECDSGAGLNTALGCIPVKPDKFAVWFLQKAVGLAGGIAFLLIIWGAFNVITSGGNPEKLNNGKEIIVSAVSGLLMIIFSVVLLKIIGYDILGIPGFNK